MMPEPHSTPPGAAAKPPLVSKVAAAIVAAGETAGFSWGDNMPFRSPAARIAAVLAVLLASLPAFAGEFTDAAGRRVLLPDLIERVMPAGPASAVFVYVLVPNKLIGWPVPLTRAQRALLPAKYARLPAVGDLAGPYPTATADTVTRLHPDLIIGYGSIGPDAVAYANHIQQQTHIPYILLDGSIQRIPDQLRDLGPILGAGDHGLAVANYAARSIEALRGQLLISSVTDRPLVYYGRGPDGLETALLGAPAISDIDQAGVINVARGLGADRLVRVTRDQLFAWNPQIIIAQQRSFYNALLHSYEWRGLAAVHDKKVYLAPADPFGWIDDPAGVNRTLGLYWLSNLFYPDLYQQDLGTLAREFYQLYYGVQLTDRQLEALVRPAEGANQGRRLANVPLLGAEPPPLPNTAPGNGLGTPPTGIPGRGGARGGALPATPNLPGPP
jgi:iron complex transport system substrate-binding protein